MLFPVWRTSKTYMALCLAHMEYERAHQLARVRNNDGGDHNTTRPRKIGLAWQQLRASASILIDWILAAKRKGWFGTPSRNPRKVVTRTAGDAVDRLHRMREARGLHHTGKRYPATAASDPSSHTPVRRAPDHHRPTTRRPASPTTTSRSKQT